MLIHASILHCDVAIFILFFMLYCICVNLGKRYFGYKCDRFQMFSVFISASILKAHLKVSSKADRSTWGKIYISNTHGSSIFKFS